MVRTVKEQAHAARRNAILDAMQRLMETRGYEQMTIQDILNDLQISKGAFYHYFDSKQATLEALIERMIDEVEQLLQPIVQDRSLAALEKFRSFFVTLFRWKTVQKDFFLQLLRVWYADDNALVRQKVRASRIRQVAPQIQVIIQQGIQEGVMMASYPDRVGEVVVSLILDLGDALAWQILSFEVGSENLHQLERTADTYIDALERILGVASGSLRLVDTATLKEWIIQPQDNA
jgi:AcrR family transcriptional regulator